MCAFIVGVDRPIDRSIGLTTEKTSVSVRLKARTFSRGHDLCVYVFGVSIDGTMRPTNVCVLDVCVMLPSSAFVNDRCRIRASNERGLSEITSRVFATTPRKVAGDMVH